MSSLPRNVDCAAHSASRANTPVQSRAALTKTPPFNLLARAFARNCDRLWAAWVATPMQVRQAVLDSFLEKRKARMVLQFGEDTTELQHSLDVVYDLLQDSFVDAHDVGMFVLLSKNTLRRHLSCVTETGRKSVPVVEADIEVSEVAMLSATRRYWKLNMTSTQEAVVAEFMLCVLPSFVALDRPAESPTLRSAPCTPQMGRPLDAQKLLHAARERRQSCEVGDEMPNFDIGRSALGAALGGNNKTVALPISPRNIGRSAPLSLIK